MASFLSRSFMFQVNFTHALSSIEHFDIQTGELVTLSLFVITWYDEILTWDPHDYGNISIISIPKDRTWKPKIASTRGYTNNDIYIDESDFSPAWITNDGLVTMFPAGSIRTKCLVDTTFYPFDQHECKFDFVLSHHLIHEINFSLPTGDVVIVNFVKHGEWIVESTACKVIPGSFSGVTVPTIQSTLTLRRRPSFEMVTFGVPLLFFYILNLVSCCIPPTCGERLSYVVTIYLAFVFMMLAVADGTPTNSLKLPILSYLTMMANFMNTLAIIYHIYALCLVNTPHGEIRVTQVVKKLALNEKRKRLQRTADILFKQNRVAVINGKEGTTAENTDTSELADMCTLTGLDIVILCDKLYFLAFLFYCIVLIAIIVGIFVFS